MKDIGALLDWIAAQPGLDTKRVMIAGPSYGGYVALAAAIEYGDRLRGVNPAFGITDFPTFLQTTEHVAAGRSQRRVRRSRRIRRCWHS